MSTKTVTEIGTDGKVVTEIGADGKVVPLQAKLQNVTL